MKNIINIIMLSLILVVTGGCLKKQNIQMEEEKLATFFDKADLKTEQIYRSLFDKNALDEEVSVFVKCKSITDENLKQVEKLGADIQKMSEEFLTVRCPASTLLKLAEFDFVAAIEGATNVKLRRE